MGADRPAQPGHGCGVGHQWCHWRRRCAYVNAFPSHCYQGKTGSGGTWASGGTNTEYKPANEQGIHPALKVIVIVLIILVGGIGAIAGLIAGIALMKSPVEDNQKFGKLITIISAVMLGLSLICCIIGGLSGLAAVPYSVSYNF